MKKKVNSGKAHHIIKHKNIKFKKRIFTKPKTIHHTFNNLFGTNLIENIKEEFTPQKKPEISKYEPPKENKKHNFFSFLKQKDQKHIEHKGHENKFLELFKHKKQIEETKKDKNIIMTLISEIIFFIGVIIIGFSFFYKPLFKFLVIIGSAIALIGVIMFFQSMIKIKIKSSEEKHEKKIIPKEIKPQEKTKNKKAPLFITLIIFLLILAYLFIKQKSLLNITTRISPVILISIILVFLIIILIILITIKKSKLKKIKTSQEHKEEVILRAKKHLNIQLHQLKQTETELDSLLELVNENGVVSLTQAAKVFNVTQEKIKEWAKILEDHNLIKIFYPAISEPLLRSLTIENAGKKDNRKV